MSDSGWFKKLLGENPNAKVLRERLEEAMALLASKEDALLEHERRLTDATALALRETESARALEARVRELSEAAIETDLSRSVTAELLEQAQAQANQLADSLATERAKLAATNQAKVKAETNVRTLTSQIANLQKQLADANTKLSNVEQERITTLDAKSVLETALARSERSRETILAELNESRAAGANLKATYEDSQLAVSELESRLEAATEALRIEKADSSRARATSAELLGIAAEVLFATLGRALPLALRLGASTDTWSVIEAMNPAATTAELVVPLERWFSDAGVAVKVKRVAADAIVMEARSATRGTALLALGYWVGALTLQMLRCSTNARYELSAVETNEAAVNITLTPSAAAPLPLSGVA